MQIVPVDGNLLLRQKMDDDNVSVASMSGYSTDEEASVRSTQTMSTMWIVDLAGSERSKRTEVGSMRQRESTQINKSLMTLMRCLNAIKDSHSSNIVPFRESKLTHIFMSHLTSRSAARTAIMVNVNPAIEDFDETQHVLAYARKAKLIEIKLDEHCHKRKQHFGEEYNLNGRKKAKPVTKNHSTTTSYKATKTTQKTLLSRVAKKLSPKRVLEKIPTSIKQGHDMISSGIFGATSNVVSKAGEMHNEIESLKTSLHEAKAYATRLEMENIRLQEELGHKEDQIRTEVAFEMEEHLREMRMKHNEKLESLKAQLNKQMSKTEFAVSMDRAENQLEELMDKVDECEKEILRMSREHRKEIESLKAQNEDLKEKLCLASKQKDHNDSTITALEKKLKDKTRDMRQRQEKKRTDEDEVEGIREEHEVQNEDITQGETMSSNVGQLKFSLSVGKKTIRRELRPRKPLLNSTNRSGA
jgi:regulator of replication initiation timing